VTAKRRREFTAGRACARRALALLGLEDAAIPVGAEREPLWPAGVVGSITHCHGYCAAAVARCSRATSIGIDAELNVTLPPGVEPLVCTEAERRWLRSAPGAGQVRWATLIFSAKESVYKAWFPPTRRWLEFADVELTIDPERGTFVARVSAPVPPSLRPCHPFPGRFALAGERLLTAVALGPAT
jgi:4'-phosphopantetheinyl transferase EntD